MSKHKKISDVENGTYCLNCIWWWDLYDTGERICYRAKSVCYHAVKKPFEGCKAYESLLRHRKDCKLGFYNEHKKG